MILLKSFSVNRIWKVVIAIMASLSALSFISCTNLNKDIAKEVCTGLKEKYNEEFIAEKIGDRLNTDSATLILHPSNNQELRFIAKINRETREITDDYYQQIIGNRLREIIEDSLHSRGISTTVRVFTNISEGKEPSSSDMSFHDFIELCDIEYYLLFIAIENNNDYTDELVRSCLEEICDNEHISIGVYCFGFPPQSYALCRNELLENPLVSETQIKGFEPVFVSSFLINSEGEE